MEGGGNWIKQGDTEVLYIIERGSQCEKGIHQRVGNARGDILYTI
jgi:hypothetical protein